MYAKLGHLDTALAIVDASIEKWRGRLDSTMLFADRHEVIACYAMATEDYAHAIDEFLRGRAVSGDSTNWQVSLGEAYRKAGRYNEAIAELTDYTERIERSGWPGGSYLKALYLLADAKERSRKGDDRRGDQPGNRSVSDRPQGERDQNDALVR